MFSTSGAALCLLLCAVITLCSSSSGGGFSVELLHRDNPKSPLYDPSATHFDRAMAAARRSNLRAQQIAARRLSAGSSVDGVSVSAEIIPNYGVYLVTYEVGTPPIEIKGMLDTGSELTWTNCKPCTKCWPQAAPLFDPSNSTTYQNLPCEIDACTALASHQCDNQGSCQFHYGYDGDSNLDGHLARESIGFATTDGGKATFPDYPFGCAFQSVSKGANDMVAGVVGLSRGSLSLVSQLHSLMGYKFSYCLPPFDKPQTISKINFSKDIVYPPSAAVTPLMQGPKYHVILKEIIVGSTTISVPLPPVPGTGNIFLDTGTTLTILHAPVLQQVIHAVVGLVKHPRSNSTSYGDFGFCFDDPGLVFGNYPGMTFVFYQGARLELAATDVFLKPGIDVVCLAMTSVRDLQILGNMAQQNKDVIFDLDAQMVAFAPGNCGGA